MDPLSAIRGLMPGLQQIELPQQAQNAIQQAGIPQGELRELGASAPPLAIGRVGGGKEVFGEMLDNLVTQVNTKQFAAKDAARGLLAGEDVPLHQAMITMQEASVSFQLLVEVRNKLLESYQEIMRMQV